MSAAWRGAPTRLTAYLPDDMVAAIQKDARAKGQTLTEWMRRAANFALMGGQDRPVVVRDTAKRRAKP